MSENLFIQKRKRARSKPFLTLRVIFGLLFLSAVIAAGFYFEYGHVGDTLCEGPCDSAYSFSTWALGAFILLIGIIFLAFVVVSIFMAIRRYRNRTDNLSILTQTDNDTDTLPK